MLQQPLTAGWQCAVCGATVDITQPFTWRCPNATGTDRRHALQLIQGIAPLRSSGEANPFLAFRPYLAWDAFVAAAGPTDAARHAMVGELDALVAAVEGHGFVTTPFERADALSDVLGFGADGGVWVKDETNNVGGSHKARHLFTILLHLRAAEQLGMAPWASAPDRPPLAIASCGNAAIAASTLAAAVSWPIRVFVPAAANPVVVARLHSLGATVVECPRLPSDPPGDPCVHRFREAVAAGAVPFSVQGTENAWCLDGGRTIGWEMARVMEETIEGPPFDRLFVQVGGGAFAACVAAGFRMSGISPKLHAVQTESCAPLARAWQRSAAVGGPRHAAAHWADCMWPWEHVGATAADGILDDETYDWLPVLSAMADSNGSPVVVAEQHVLEANDVGCRATGIDASHTGTAGLAGVVAQREAGELAPDERVAVIFSGIRR
ncbi:MAG: PLP-dependent lyase/thiolase [Actinomycetota bacterium]|nr:PLP-dependent lyase/thiolase [Actinomycetota bacterium]